MAPSDTIIAQTLREEGNNMDEQERQQRNAKAVAGIRDAIARFASQLRGEGLPETEIRLIIEEASVDVVRKMGALSPDEPVPPELSDAISITVKDVMNNGSKLDI
jgi:hypothetical protein